MNLRLNVILVASIGLLALGCNGSGAAQNGPANDTPEVVRAKKILASQVQPSEQMQKKWSDVAQPLVKARLANPDSAKLNHKMATISFVEDQNESLVVVTGTVAAFGRLGKPATEFYSLIVHVPGRIVRDVEPAEVLKIARATEVDFVTGFGASGFERNSQLVSD